MCLSFSKQTIYVLLYTLGCWWSETGDVSCRPPKMRLVAHSLVSNAIFVLAFNRNNLLFQLPNLRFKLSPGFHSFFNTYLWKLKSNSEEIDVKASDAFENSAQNTTILKKCSAVSQSVSPIRQDKVILPGAIKLPKLRKKTLCLSQSAFSNFGLYIINGVNSCHIWAKEK